MENKIILLLDLDDTLLDFHRAEHEAIKKTFAAQGIAADEAVIARYSEINRIHWEMLESKQITRRPVLVGRFEMLFKELGIAADADETQKLYEDFLSVGHYFMPGAEELLKTLDGRCRMFLCSNGTAKVQAGRIASAGIARYFEKIFISEDIGHDKPSREYFDACSAQIPGYDPKYALMVGDSLTSDILGGINAKIRTCRYNPHLKPGREDIKPDYVISELDQLPELLFEKICW